MTPANPKHRPPTASRQRRQSADLLFLTILGLVPVLLYARTLGFGYVRADDVDLVVRNQPFISELTNVPRAFQRSYFEVEGELTDLKTYYRPLVIVSLMVDAQISGIDPAAYHATNVAIHVAVVLLLFGLARQLGAGPRAAFTASILFAVHPLNVQTVCWIVGRNESLLATFVLVSLLGLHGYVTREARTFLVLHLAAFGLALFTKETGLVLLPLFGLMTWLWYGKPRFYVDRPGLAAVYVLITGGWLLMRMSALAGGAGGATPIESLGTILTNLPQVLSYAGQVVFPVQLNVMPGTDLVSSLTGLVGIGVLAYVFRRARPVQKTAALVGWLVIFLAPGLIVPDLPAYEHRAYVPLLGVMIGMSQLGVLNGGVWRWAQVRLVLRVVFVVFAVMSVRHADTFRDPFTYWESATRGTSYAPIAHVNLGRMHEEGGNLSEAEAQYRAALAIDPATPKANNNLGVVMMATERESRAEEYFKQELEVNPTSAEAQFNLGLCSSEAGDSTNPAGQEAEAWHRTSCFGPDRVFEPADTLNLDCHAIAVLEKSRWRHREADPVRGAREDDRAWRQRRALAHEAHQCRHVEDHVGRRPVLNDLVVDERPHAQRIRILNVVLRDDVRTQRAKRVEALAAAPL